MVASFHPSCDALKKKFWYLQKITVLLSRTLSQTPDLQNFASAYRSSKRVIDLAWQGGCSERDKLDRRRSAKLTVPPSSDARPLVYHSSHQALSTAQFSCAGPLATAASCYSQVCIDISLHER